MTVPIRRRSRELAMQALYQSETTGQAAEAAFEQIRENFQANKRAAAYALELLAGVKGCLADIDGLIRAHSTNWRLERMTCVDRNILRIAVFELLAKKDIPVSVIINEAIEVAVRYSDEDAPPFINGILDSLKKKLGR